MTFAETALSSGFGVSHTAGSTNVQITQPGIYQAVFSAAVTPAAGTAIPAAITLALNSNGVKVPGALTAKTFTATKEASTLMFSAPFQITATPVALTVSAEQAGFDISNAFLCIHRLGNISAIG